MVFNATFNNISAISWQSVLLMEETGVPGENDCLVYFVFLIYEDEPLMFCVVEIENLSLRCENNH
jgi:hypothetical protein